MARGDPEQAQDLLSARARRKAYPEADADLAFDEALLDHRIESGQAGCRDLRVRPAAARVAQREGAGERLVLPQQRAARARVTRADAVVDERSGLARRVPWRHRIGPDLELERRRHAVVRVVAVALGILPMGVEIDEPGSDHEAAHVECLAGGERFGRDGGDATAQDGDVADGVEPRLGVEDAPAREHEIVLRAGARRTDAPKARRTDA